MYLAEFLFILFNLVRKALHKALHMGWRERICSCRLPDAHEHNEILFRVPRDDILTKLFWYFIKVH